MIQLELFPNLTPSEAALGGPAVQLGPPAKVPTIPPLTTDAPPVTLEDGPSWDVWRLQDRLAASRVVAFTVYSEGRRILVVPVLDPKHRPHPDRYDSAFLHFLDDTERFATRLVQSGHSYSMDLVHPPKPYTAHTRIRLMPRGKGSNNAQAPWRGISNINMTSSVEKAAKALATQPEDAWEAVMTLVDEGYKVSILADRKTENGFMCSLQHTSPEHPNSGMLLFGRGRTIINALCALIAKHQSVRGAWPPPNASTGEAPEFG